MGRHVNHFDVQDRLISANAKKSKKGSIVTELSLSEQIALDEKRKHKNAEIIASRPPTPPPPIRYSGKK